MLSLVKITMWVIKRVIQLTVYELLWIFIFTLTLITIWNWRNDYTKTDHYPVIVWWTDGFPGVAEIKTCPDNLKCEVSCNKNANNAEAYLFYGSNINTEDLPIPRRPNNVIWGLYHEESPRNVEELMHEEMLSLFNFSSTFSRYSDVAFPLQYLESIQDITNADYFVETSLKNEYLNVISPIMYLQSDCETSTERDKYVKELMKFIQVDSYGMCLKNKEMPSKFREDYLNNLNDDEFLKFIARYKFVIAIENGVCEDYVTEKFWRAIKVGTVPIYFGSPSVRDWFPNNKSAILLLDFPTPKLLHDHIQVLMNNDSLYEEYLEHKTKQTITNQRLVQELKMRPYQTNAIETVLEFECFVCKKIHENDKSKINIVSKKHYDCPKPISALSLGVNPQNDWLYSWQSAKEKVRKIYDKINDKH